MSLLELKNVTASYSAGSQALHQVDLKVDERSVTALLGANGAGKTTTLRAISGMVRRNGTILFDGQDISTWSTDRIARAGVAHVPQGRGTLTGLTVHDNLFVGAARRRGRRQVQDDLDACLDLFPRLGDRIAALAGTLSGGEQQMLALARALMGRPRLLLLDEPSLGLAPKITREVFGAVERLRDLWELSILVVEQNADLALTIADRALLVEAGAVVRSGSAYEFEQSDDIRRAYLGA